MRPKQGQEPKLQNLTREEIKKIQRSMKRPQFMGLLNEYMIEISDPKNKDQYDQYLRQMEQEGQLPKHMKLVKLKPQFCFRTHIVSNKNKKHEMKFFINMCSTDYIEKPSCEPANGPNGGGYSWKVPNSMGKIRYDQDRHKDPCQVVDCGFHPDTFLFATSPAFQAMIISIALQSAERQLGERKQSLSKDYVILKNVKCKSQNGEPALLPIRVISGKAYNRGQGPAQLQRDLQGKQTKLQKDINEQKQAFKKQKQMQEKDKKMVQEDKEEDLDDDSEKKKLVQDLQQGIHAPKYTSIYTYKTEYSDFLDEPIPRRRRKLPDSFSVQFKVPRMSAISEASKLQISQNKILLEVIEKYYIDLSFESLKVKYPLSTNQAKAKFDKKRKTLKVQIPIDQGKLEEDMIQTETINEKKEEIEDENTAYVQNQLWKNKVLEIPETAVDNKFIAEEQIENTKKQEKKLVEQIDEDDFIDDEQIKEKQIQDHSFPPIFTLREYYKDKQQNVIAVTENKVKNLNTLPFLFSENSKMIIIMIRMENYIGQEVKAVYSLPENQEKEGDIIVKWEKLEQSAIWISHLKIQRINKISKINLIKRVGFYVFSIEKDNAEIWGRQSLKDISHNYLNKQINVFQSEFNQISDRMQAQQKSRQKKQQIKVADKKVPQPIVQQKIEQKDKLIKKMEQLDNDEPQKKPQKEIQSKSQTKPEELNQAKNIFEKLPFQFIKFHVPFIDVLN